MWKRTFYLIIIGLVFVFLFINLISDKQTLTNKKTKIIIWYAWQDTDALEREIYKFEKRHKKIKVEMFAFPFGGLEDNFLLTAPRGQGPDLFIGPNDWIGQLAEKRCLEPLNDLQLNQNLMNEFIPYAVTAIKYQDKLYGLPLAAETATLFYNTNLVKTPPRNTEELITIARLNTGKGRYGLIYDINNFYYSVCWFHGFGATIFDKDGTPSLNSPEALKAGAFISDLYHRYKVIPKETNFSIMTTLFNQGKAAMIITGPWSWLNGFKVPFKMARIPLVSETKKPASPFIGVRTIMLNRFSKNKAAAIEVMKFLSSAEVSAAFTKETKLIPVNKVAYDNPEIKNDPIINAFKDQAEVGIPLPNTLNMRATWGPAIDAIGLILNEKKTPKQALNRAQLSIMNSI